jgi:phosphoribosylformylglycinamidine cyclo-ligase
VVRAGSWPVPPIFGAIARRAGVTVEEAFRVFNLGVGMAVVVDPAHADACVDAVRDAGSEAYRIGEVTGGDGMIRIDGATEEILAS